ncbi:isocitrate lyase/phosphoenolpyruvate mutase family protein, partial [Burkholderia sp. SIMBA_013]
YDALSAKMIEQAGFDVVLIAGGTYSNFHYGVPDNGFISQGELIEAGRRITAITDLPLILDFDDAGGSPLQAFRGVQLA